MKKIHYVRLQLWDLQKLRLENFVGHSHTFT